MKVTLSKRAIKFLKKQEKAIQLRIYAGLKGLTKKPPAGNLEKMKGMVNTYRLRIGTYRVICTFDYTNDLVDIQTIDNRGDVY